MGGSESRFIIHPDFGSDYITQPSKSKIGEPTKYAARDTKDGYQKVLVKTEGKYAAIRFDAHPQNYLGIVNGVLVMESKWSKDTQWKVIIIQKKTSAEDVWLELTTPDLNLGYDANKEKSLNVAFFHPATKSLLRYDQGTDAPQVVQIPFAYGNGKISTAERLSFASILACACWSLECVGHNVSANELVRPPRVPCIDVGETVFHGYNVFDSSPVIALSAGAELVSHGKGLAADRLENLCFDAGRSGLVPQAWDDAMAALRARIIALEQKVIELQKFA